MPIVSIPWSDVVADLSCTGYDQFDVRKPYKGVTTRRDSSVSLRSEDVASTHCILFFSDG